MGDDAVERAAYAAWAARMGDDRAWDALPVTERRVWDAVVSATVGAMVAQSTAHLSRIADQVDKAPVGVLLKDGARISA